MSIATLIAWLAYQCSPPRRPAGQAAACITYLRADGRASRQA